MLINGDGHLAFVNKRKERGTEMLLIERDRRGGRVFV